MSSSAKSHHFAPQKNVYSLDALHTDRLLQAQGLNTKRSSTLSSIPQLTSVCPPSPKSSSPVGKRKDNSPKETPARVRRHSLGALTNGVGQFALSDAAGASKTEKHGSGKNEALFQIDKQASVKNCSKRLASNHKKVSPIEVAPQQRSERRFSETEGTDASRRISKTLTSGIYANNVSDRSECIY
jgi:hypothetical protein